MISVYTSYTSNQADKGVWKTLTNGSFLHVTKDETTVQLVVGVIAAHFALSIDLHFPELKVLEQYQSHAQPAHASR